MKEYTLNVQKKICIYIYIYIKYIDLSIFNAIGNYSLYIYKLHLLKYVEVYVCSLLWGAQNVYTCDFSFLEVAHTYCFPLFGKPHTSPWIYLTTINKLIFQVIRSIIFS